MDEYFVIAAIDHEIWYTGSHNSCCMWVLKWINPQSWDKFYIIPSSMVEKYGLITICDKMLEYDEMRKNIM